MARRTLYRKFLRGLFIKFVDDFGYLISSRLNNPNLDTKEYFSNFLIEKHS